MKTLFGNGFGSVNTSFGYQAMNGHLPTQDLFGGSQAFVPMQVRLGQKGLSPAERLVPPNDRTPIGKQALFPAQKATAEEKGKDRICEMAKKFSETQPGSDEEQDARSRIFWSFIRSNAKKSGQSEDVMAQEIQSRCPGITVPEKPPAPAPMQSPKEKGFHGKTQLSYAEAKELSDILTVVLTPLTPEEAAKELARQECLRNIVKADGFPIVEDLQARLKDFIAAGNQTATFVISQGEIIVTGHAVECAAAIGRAKTIRTVATAGGVAAGGAGLLWLVGLL